MTFYSQIFHASIYFAITNAEEYDTFHIILYTERNKLVKKTNLCW